MDISLYAALEKMSARTPESSEKSLLGARDTALACARFLNENFRGLIEVGYPEDITGSIRISEEELAYFFKLLLRYTNLRCYLTVKIASCGSDFCLSVEKDSQTEFTEEQTAALIRCAKKAGFSVRYEPDRIILRTSAVVPERPAAQVYAKSDDIIINTFFKIFF